MEEKYYEFKIWSKLAPEDELSLPKITEHTVTAEPTVAVEGKDIPAEVYLSAIGIKYLTVLRLSPCPSSKTAYTFMRKYAEKLAHTLEGVLEDEMAEKRFSYFCEKNIYAPINEYTEMMTLSVWFVRDGGFDGLYREIVDTFERVLPAALPSKYGTGLSPEIVFEDGEVGKAGLIEYWKGTPALTWLGRTPITHVFISDAARVGVSRTGERANRLCVSMPSSLYEIEEWREALCRLLCELTNLTGAFFGQICRGESGVVSWWWQGIPAELGVACTIGEPYFSLIPDCASVGKSIGGGVAYFEEPIGPFIENKYLSLKKKKKIARRASVLLPSDFEAAEVIPVDTYK